MTIYHTLKSHTVISGPFFYFHAFTIKKLYFIFIYTGQFDSIIIIAYNLEWPLFRAHVRLEAQVESSTSQILIWHAEGRNLGCQFILVYLARVLVPVATLTRTKQAQLSRHPTLSKPKCASLGELDT